ncbi:hypothetical protein AMATHDRAFT_3452 [Amanita thiersii Skay4041]|uniref:Uncharacterized protein n=1 Tax=Amanita thiersii Skay4041 TaxID=703135 RepID=A0A2A9NNN6_9AGAR|nr:hypothetical protein AMATHDRAFT_3452 [Amanita thiersii Skay4041]
MQHRARSHRRVAAAQRISDTTPSKSQPLVPRQGPIVLFSTQPIQRPNPDEGDKPGKHPENGFTSIFPPLPTSDVTLPIPLTTSPTPVPVVIPPVTSVVVPSTTSLRVPSTPSTTSVVVPTTSTTPLPSTMSTSTTRQSVALVTEVRTVTPTTSRTATAASSTASVSGGSSNSNTGAVVGGVLVGVLVLGALVFGASWFVRRSRRQKEDQFDADNFRRSAVLIHDPAPHDDYNSQGTNPRPPTMIERKLASSPLGYGSPYGAPPPADYYDAPAGYYPGQVDYNQPYSPSFVPGQVVNPIVPLPMTSQGLYPTAVYEATGHNVTGTQMQPPSPPPPLTRQPTNQSPPRSPIVRPASGNAPGAANGFTFPPRQHSQRISDPMQHPIPDQPAVHQVPADDYVDLSRSSVSPFQAAQYVEISKKLNTEVPRGLNNTTNDEMPAESQGELSQDAPPPLPPKDPFEDPSSRPESPKDSIRDSYESAQYATQHPMLNQFPAPPSPVQTIASRHRIDSLPPTLPEINGGGSPLIQRKSLIPEPTKFQATPSPLASSSIIANNIESQATTPANGPQHGGDSAPKIKRPETVYNPEDAYGGI